MRDLREMGDDGWPLPAVMRTPYQQLWIQWVLIDDLAAHLVDRPELVEETAALMAGIERQIFAVVRLAAQRVPVPMIDVPDNITAPVIGPKNFRKDRLPRYNELAEMLADVGTLVYVHMDGDLKPLWKLIGESGVRGIDSLSPPPDNDTSVGQAHALWPEMRLCRTSRPPSTWPSREQMNRRWHGKSWTRVGTPAACRSRFRKNVPPGVWRRSFPPIRGRHDNFGAPVRAERLCRS